MKKKGYVMLPCFKVECDMESEECELVCNSFLAWIFETFFKRFWKGKVYLKK